MTLTTSDIADRLEIQETLTRYSTALDVPGRKWEEWDKCFAPDAICDYGENFGRSLSPAELKAIFQERNDAVRIHGQHLLSNIVISVTGDRASARTECFHASLNRVDAAGRAQLNFAGLFFEDELTRTADGWRITVRKFSLRWKTSHGVDWEGETR